MTLIICRHRNPRVPRTPSLELERRAGLGHAALTKQVDRYLAALRRGRSK